MAFRIITADERLSAAENKTSLAIFGPPGVGKTTLLKTLPAEETVCLDLEAEGHYGIYGCAGSGKTMLLKAILCSLGRWYRPKDISIYIIDLGSWSLKTMEQMPHVGGVVLSSEEEKFDKLAYILREEFAKRKKAFSKHGISSLKDYRENVSDDIPAVVLAIDSANQR